MAARPGFSLLSVAANYERHKLSSGEAFLLLLHIEIPGDGAPAQPGVTVAPQHVRMVSNLDPVEFDADDGLGPQTYEPFNFTVGEFAQSSSGAVPDVEVQASNVMRALEQTIDQYGGIVGANLNLYAVSTANPAGEPDLALAFTVISTSSDAKLVHMKVGASSPLRRLFPIHVYRPNFCIWQYNAPALQAVNAPGGVLQILSDLPGVQCGYVGPLTSCDHTIDGANGCQVHGNTLRFGGFPGIDTNGAIAGTVV